MNLRPRTESESLYQETYFNGIGRTKTEERVRTKTIQSKREVGNVQAVERTKVNCCTKSEGSRLYTMVKKRRLSSKEQTQKWLIKLLQNPRQYGPSFPSIITRRGPKSRTETVSPVFLSLISLANTVRLVPTGSFLRTEILSRTRNVLKGRSESDFGMVQ